MIQKSEFTYTPSQLDEGSKRLFRDVVHNISSIFIAFVNMRISEFVLEDSILLEHLVVSSARIMWALLDLCSSYQQRYHQQVSKRRASEGKTVWYKTGNILSPEKVLDLSKWTRGPDWEFQCGKREFPQAKQYHAQLLARCRERNPWAQNVFWEYSLAYRKSTRECQKLTPQTSPELPPND